MSEERPETRSSFYVLASHSTHVTQESLSENHKILLYMDNVFDKLTRMQNAHVIVVTKNSKHIKSNIMPIERAKFTFAALSTFCDKIKNVMEKLLPDEPLECIRLKGVKHGEMFMTLDEHLEIIVIDKNYGR